MPNILTFSNQHEPYICIVSKQYSMQNEQIEIAYLYYILQFRIVSYFILKMLKTKIFQNLMKIEQIFSNENSKSNRKCLFLLIWPENEKSQMSVLYRTFDIDKDLSLIRKGKKLVRIGTDNSLSK